MNRTFVCLETSEFFTRQIARVAAAEGDRLLLVSHQPTTSADSPSLRLDIRGIPAEVAAKIREACGDAPPAAAITNQEVYVNAAAAVAGALGVARNPVGSAAAARDKALMKEVWREAGVRTADGTHFRSRRDLEGVTFRYPLVIKPTLGFASCGVRRVNSDEELRAQATKIGLINATTLAPGEPAGFLVEQCLDGPEYCIDTIWFDGEPVGDCLMSRNRSEEAISPYYPDRLYVLDQALSPEQRGIVLDLAHAAVRALGITHGPTHTEIRFDGSTPYVLEAAARPGAGALFYELMAHAHGVDFARALYLSQVCEDREEFERRLGSIEWRPLLAGDCYFWYNMPYSNSGIVKEIVGLDELRERPEVLLCICYKEPGSHIHSDGDLNSDYFCNILGRYRSEPDGPTLDALLRDLDGTVKLVF